MLKSEGKGVLEVWERCGCEMRSGVGIIIEKQRLAWREK